MKKLPKWADAPSIIRHKIQVLVISKSNIGYYVSYGKFDKVSMLEDHIKIIR